MPTALTPELVEALRHAEHIAVLTGAGISAESGVPTFRGAQTGLWARYRPEDLATPEAFRRDPRLVWEWYAWRRELVWRARPNAGHKALAALEQRVPRLTLLTQNVDGLHQQAGSRAVIELHGNIHRNICAEDGAPVENWSLGLAGAPLCPRCGGLVRPDVVWFGEALPRPALAAAFEAAAKCDLFLAIGTSALVQPAASLPLRALERGVPVLEINPEPTPLTERTAWALRGYAGRILPALVDTAWPPAA